MRNIGKCVNSSHGVVINYFIVIFMKNVQECKFEIYNFITLNTMGIFHCKCIVVYPVYIIIYVVYNLNRNTLHETMYGAGYFNIELNLKLMTSKPGENKLFI